MSALDELQAAVRTAADRADAATVAVGRDRRGAGVVIAPGRILTNAHNLRDRTISVTFADGRTEQAVQLGVDVDGDLAVLEVDTGTATPLTWRDDALPLGAPVLAAARGGQGVRVTVGFVSGVGQTFRGPRGRRITGSIEHTAPLARGSSGGPLLDVEGRLVGVNTLRLGDGFTLALPVDEALRTRVERLGAGETPQRRRLGIAVAPAPVARRMRAEVGLPEQDGLLVRGVEEGSPADAAGVRVGDLVVAVDGTPVVDADGLWTVLAELADPDTAQLSVVRGVTEVTLTVRFTAPEAAGDESA